MGRLREAEISRAEWLERASRVARFVSVGMFVGWVADVTAAFAPGAGSAAPVYGLASVALAVVIVGAYALAQRTLARADALRSLTERSFTIVRVGEVQPLLAHAASDAVVAQYLRMVGRQSRPLRQVELAALTRWAAEPAGGLPPVGAGEDRRGCIG
jgi:hypothetical protein